MDYNKKLGETLDLINKHHESSESLIKKDGENLKKWVKTEREWVALVERNRMEKISKKEFDGFYSEDCYLVFNSNLSKKNEVFLWIGSESKKEETCVAIELLNWIAKELNGQIVLHRELQNNESPAFLGLFQPFFSLKGTFWNSLQKSPSKFKTRLLFVQDRSKLLEAIQVPLTWKSLTCDEPFVLDFGKEV